MPEKAQEEPKPLSFATPNPWSALPREVHVGTGHGKKEGATTESPVDGQDQPKIYTIRDHTLEVLMHPDVLELHAVRVVHTPHGDERQLHLKVRVRCGREEKVVDVLVDTGAQVSLVRRGLFKEELLQPSRRPVRLKVANGEIMGGGTHEATISMEFWEHERLNRPDQAKRSTLSGNWYVADITDWDMIMGYDFMVANAIGALHHRATLVREDDECLTWLSTDYACGSSQWNAGGKGSDRPSGASCGCQVQRRPWGSAHGVWNGATGICQDDPDAGSQSARDGRLRFPGCPTFAEV